MAAAHHFDPVSRSCCARSPDTPEIGEETTAAVRALREARGDGVHSVEAMVPKPPRHPLLQPRRRVVCPSVYEPLGIVNLEAMACSTG